jgi:hypothetical protein
MNKYKLFVGFVVAQRNAPWMICGALAYGITLKILKILMQSTWEKYSVL